MPLCSWEIRSSFRRNEVYHDQQFPPALVKWLATRGQSASHVREIGLRDADDREIWQRAEQDGAVIMTKDEDFVLLRTAAGSGPVVVWLRIGNAETQVLFAWLDSRWTAIEAALASGRGVIEVR